MKKEMLINVSEGEECRIALVEDGKLEELYVERTSSTSHVGNIYKGRVTNVEPSIQAAFVDFGLGRNGFLHISDLMPTYFGRRGENIEERVGQKMARRDRPPIQRCLRRGDDIIVQIIKEGIGTKGPTLSTYLSIPGRILVMMPGMSSKGVSRKIEDEPERRRLRQILDQLDPPDDVGFIIRTAGVGKTKADIERDLKFLVRLWETLKKKQEQPAPVELYTEGDLVTRTVRDLFSADVDRIVVDNAEVAARVKDVIKITAPRTKNRVDLYEDTVPLFHQYGIEREIEQMYSRHVPLPSGGSLVIDSTEAIVAIDVNSGKFRDHSDAEMTAFKTDMEAAEEICRQLRLRDLGGVIICDFIDLRYERHRRDLEQKLQDLLKNDRAKTKFLRMSQFGIIEMTRQRMRPSLKRSVYFDCPHCKGAGLVKTPESMSLDVMRRIAIAASDGRVQRVELTICPDVNFYLQNRKRRQIADLEDRHRKRVIVRADPHMGLDEMRLELFDARDGLVVIDELQTVLQGPPHRSQLATRPAQPPPGRGGGAGRFEERQQAGQSRRPPHPQPPGRGGGREHDRGRGRGRDREEVSLEEKLELDRADQVEAREEELDREAADADAGAPSPAVAGGDNGRPFEGRDDRDRHNDRGGGGGGGGDRGGRRERGDERRDRDQRQDRGQRQARDRQPQDRDRAERRDDRGDTGRDDRPDFARPEPTDRGPGGADQPADEQGQGEGGGRRRRRRRRGRRGRGRGRGPQEGQFAPAGEGDAGQPPAEGHGPDDEEGYAEPAYAGEREDGDDDAEGALAAGGYDDRRDREGDEDSGAPAPAPEPVEDDRDDGIDLGGDAEVAAEARRGGGREEFDTEAEGPTVEAEAYRPEVTEPEPTPAPAAAEEAPEAEAPRGRGRGRAHGGSRSRKPKRGAGTEPAEPTAEAPPAAAPTDEPPAETGGKRPRRRTGGARAAAGTGRGRKRKTDEPPAGAVEAPVETGSPTDAGGAGASAPAQEPPAGVDPRPPGRSRSRSRSADAHLMSDEHENEPLRPTPARRPRSTRDLDEIPEDLF